eukprot:1158203-Pelagomonas_calceolata.AAC.9
MDAFIDACRSTCMLAWHLYVLLLSNPPALASVQVFTGSYEVLMHETLNGTLVHATCKVLMLARAPRKRDATTLRLLVQNKSRAQSAEKREWAFS